MTDEQLYDAIRHIERTLLLRWWIFAVMAMALIIAAIGAIANLRAVERIETIVLKADSRSLRNEAAIDAGFKQQIIYQQQMAQSIEFLAKKNPKLNVPRSIVTVPVPAVTPTVVQRPLSESELARPKTPTPSPLPKPEPQLKGKKRKPSPTPGPFERLFKPRSTR